MEVPSSRKSSPMMLCLIPITLTWRITADVKTLCTNQLSGEPQKSINFNFKQDYFPVKLLHVSHVLPFAPFVFAAWGITKLWTHYIITPLLDAFDGKCTEMNSHSGLRNFISSHLLLARPGQPDWSDRSEGVSALLHEDRSQWQTLISNSAQDKEFSVKDLANIWPGLSLFQMQRCMYTRYCSITHTLAWSWTCRCFPLPKPKPVLSNADTTPQCMH